MSDTVYIKMDRSVEVTHEKVTIGDIAKIESKNKNIVNNIKPIKILADKPELGNRYVISIMKTQAVEHGVTFENFRMLIYQI